VSYPWIAQLDTMSKMMSVKKALDGGVPGKVRNWIRIQTDTHRQGLVTYRGTRTSTKLIGRR
jgi:hypothetical protein